MNGLIIEPNLTDHDDVYQCIVDMHDNRSMEDSLIVTSKFALLLANHIGDPSIIRAAAAIAGSKSPNSEQPDHGDVQ
ncbi:MAG: DUF2783 domain-containing protein [Henriciella sp.]